MLFPLTKSVFKIIGKEMNKIFVLDSFDIYKYSKPSYNQELIFFLRFLVEYNDVFFIKSRYCRLQSIELIQLFISWHFIYANQRIYDLNCAILLVFLKQNMHCKYSRLSLQIDAQAEIAAAFTQYDTENSNEYSRQKSNFLYTIFKSLPGSMITIIRLLELTSKPFSRSSFSIFSVS